MRKLLYSASVATLLVIGTACDSVDPVAPEGSVLTISVSPTFIELTGEATVTVVARKPNGQPVNKGSEVFFATTLGTIDQAVATDDNGVAEATLRGDGRAGTATITATSGAASAAVSDPIQIGSFAALISLQVTPTVVLEEGGELFLLALVRDDTGVLLPNAVVNFGTEFGVLDSLGAGIVTDINGEATDKLTVSPADVVAAGSSFQVSAQTAGTGGVEVSASFTVSVAVLEPIAAFSFTISGLTVTFQSQSTGAEPLKLSWDFDEDGRSRQHASATLPSRSRAPERRRSVSRCPTSSDSIRRWRPSPPDSGSGAFDAGWSRRTDGSRSGRGGSPGQHPARLALPGAGPLRRGGGDLSRRAGLGTG